MASSTKSADSLYLSSQWYLRYGFIFPNQQNCFTVTTCRLLISTRSNEARIG